MLWEFYYVLIFVEYVIFIVFISGYLCKVIYVWDEIDYSLNIYVLWLGKVRKV